MAQDKGIGTGGKTGGTNGNSTRETPSYPNPAPPKTDTNGKGGPSGKPTK